MGYHWAQRPDLGDPQLTFNYVRALSDFTTNFVFSKGVGFRSPDATSAIVPTRLQRIWEKDNRKDSLLWEMGSMGSVTGDCFVKVAYEEPWTTYAPWNHRIANHYTGLGVWAWSKCAPRLPEELRNNPGDDHG